MVDINRILRENNFRFNHSLGQNFITDTALLGKIVDNSNITNEDIVVEIGTGAGTLTREIAKVAKRVITFELDKNLIPILDKTLADFDNIELVFKDILKMSDDEVNSIVRGRFKIVANLPYYITTPLIMRFLESNLPVDSITVMVQQEVAERLVAKANTTDYGVITIAVDLYGDATIPLRVDKTFFYPVPKVDSAVVKIDVNRNKYEGVDKAELMKLVKCGFSMRRKVLTNNLKVGYNIPKEQGEKMLNSLGFDRLVRGEALSTADYIKLLDIINNLTKVRND